ncbi:hypothetical protein HK097_004078 [Rhizophlyctis rosea]|uniref:Uncharacterized protein n=1 Tax=Rhizophlyctis rosea TaxID=64517 RepID=A0AAD5SF38_9FUNG|nr:hypothetical protein HK097_004078 [Rhizophlyctis rosea]
MEELWTALLARFGDRDSIASTDVARYLKGELGDVIDNRIDAETPSQRSPPQLTIRTTDLQTGRRLQEPSPVTPGSTPAPKRKRPQHSTGDDGGSRSDTPSEDGEPPAPRRSSRNRNEGGEQTGNKHFTLCEWSTPQPLCDKIQEFCKLFGTFLDPCWNTESQIRPDYSYGRRSEGMDDFVDAIALERWCVPKDESEGTEPKDWTAPVDILYLNPPYNPTHPTSSVNTKSFLNRLMDEMDCGNVKAALVMLNINTFTLCTQRIIEKGALVALMKERLVFDLSRFDQKHKG